MRPFFQTAIGRLLEGFASERPWRHVLRLTAFLLLLYPIGTAHTALLKTLMLLVLVFPALLESVVIWSLAVVYMLTVLIMDWYLLQNHEFLISYWVLACALACREKARSVFVVLNARLLIGLSFALALVWKCMSGDFLNGDFLLHSFLSDKRFFDLSGFLTGTSLEVLQSNRGLVEALKFYPVPGAVAAISMGPLGGVPARLLTYWTLVLETFLAAAFLLRLPAGLNRHRHIFLLIFIATTYFFLPLHRFAMILSILGFAQCEERAAYYRLAYLLLFVLIPLF